MGRSLKMPWSMEDTIENMDSIRDLVIRRVRQVNLDGKGEADVREINFDFCRVKEALKKKIPMKVKEIHADEYFCPACGTENNCDQMIISDRYCPECGQALDSEN
ncbi:MAG: hypothetical protein RR446_07390 [Lachnospiraceae bacterium]